MSRPAPTPRDGERGLALVVVLWGLALVATAIVAIGFTGRSETLIARNAIENARARQAAEAGVQLALHRLLAYPRGTRLFDGTPSEWRDGPSRVTLSIQDEEGRIDLNQAGWELIAGALRVAGLEPDAAAPLACRIYERRGYTDPHCPELDRGLLPSVTPGLIVATEELRRFAGIDDRLYARLAPLVTVHSGASSVDPRVAPGDVLRAVPGLSGGLVDSWLARRSMQQPVLGGTPEGLGELRDRRWFALSTGQTFAIGASAVTPGGGRHRAEMVVRLTWRADQPFAVLAWREPSG